MVQSLFLIFAVHRVVMKIEPPKQITSVKIVHNSSATSAMIFTTNFIKSTMCCAEKTSTNGERTPRLWVLLSGVTDTHVRRSNSCVWTARNCAVMFVSASNTSKSCYTLCVFTYTT